MGTLNNRCHRNAGTDAAGTASVGNAVKIDAIATAAATTRTTAAIATAATATTTAPYYNNEPKRDPNFYNHPYVCNHIHMPLYVHAGYVYA